VALLGQIDQVLRLDGLRGLSEDFPVERRAGGHAIDPAKIGEEEQGRLWSPSEQFGAFLAGSRCDATGGSWFGIEFETVGTSGLGEPGHVLLRPSGEVLSQVEDAVVGLVARGDLVQFDGELML